MSTPPLFIQLPTFQCRGWLISLPESIDRILSDLIPSSSLGVQTQYKTQTRQKKKRQLQTSLRQARDQATRPRSSRFDDKGQGKIPTRKVGQAVALKRQQTLDVSGPNRCSCLGPLKSSYASLRKPWLSLRSYTQHSNAASEGFLSQKVNSPAAPER